ncbi:hypothetical protein [Variovorax saccharolyticus]|uniref:hypothetical protein n=1 Tax=Variovorax saccharolyticus TaxID=3053516 RepID=UPI002575ABC3|nr:hypothetical protein [Variovorax sp. J31P216]MDM0030443.1 hypothetical protein [Variovorax sp. J31P216]
MNIPKNGDVVRDFTLHDKLGNSMPDRDWLEWLNEHDGKGFGPVYSYSWQVGSRRIETAAASKQAMELLPDATGFICFESEWKPDNCLLLDAFGSERVRLAVPWQLTRPKNPESAKPPTSFASVSEPYVNVTDGKKGRFGVTAWVELAGKYYFELDYHAGRFLWGREIRD